MVRKHIVRKEEEYNEKGELVSETEEHVIIEQHGFLEDAEEEEDLMFLSKKADSNHFEDDIPLIVINNDDNFW